MTTAANDDFFNVFAEHARKKGLETALVVFAGNIDQKKLESYVAEYRRRIEMVREGFPPAILTVPGTIGWYPGPQPDDVCWPALRTHLENHLGFDEPRVTLLDESSSKVIAYTKDPSQPTYRTQGLVVGYVQSGKTTNFTSVIAKAADVGYRLVIVLSGIHNALRKQTQDRMDAQLVAPSEEHWFSLTTPVRDFSPVQNAAPFFSAHNEIPVLCVVKKNATVLRKLRNWLRDAHQSGVLANIPALVIDDEADQASVATTRINPLIREILDLLPRASYIGYTATPFANVLIDPSPEAADLYPQTFILNLPEPDGYLGTKTIFGRDLVELDAEDEDVDGKDMVRVIPDDQASALQPARGTPLGQFVPQVDGALRTAVLYFWLATSARRARGQTEHASMLIHTSVRIAIHEAFRGPVENFKSEILSMLERGDPATRSELEQIWTAETAAVDAEETGNASVAFSELEPYLGPTITETRVILDNCRSSARLDYDSAPGQVVIAIGGNTLSRGLTLEGLTVSFFVRSARTYDTLLQMGRWFGFRPGYEDLPRIWMTDALRHHFRHLATVEHEIRLDIERYEQQGLSPLDFGVRIRTHPQLMVTSKMGAYVVAQTSYGGRRVQTRYFMGRDTEWLHRNRVAADSLVASARTAGATRDALSPGTVVYRDVPVQLVTGFLAQYESHPESPDLDRRLLLDYIARQNQQGPGSLMLWSVAIMGSDPDRGTSIDIGGETVGTIIRSRLKDTEPALADIKTLMSREHRVVDLPMDQQTVKQRLEDRSLNEEGLIAMRDDDPVYKERGLLLLYPIDKESAPRVKNDARVNPRATRLPLDSSEHAMGIALVFPGNGGNAIGNTYVSVDLSNVEIETESEELEQIEQDTEDSGEAA